MTMMMLNTRTASSSSSLMLLLILASSLSNVALGLDCGVEFWTEPCIGETDKRYDKDYTINLIEQSDNWKMAEGLYELTVYRYGTDYRPLEESPVNDIPGITVKSFPYKRFLNFTFDGSRSYRHSLDILANSQDFLPGGVNPADAYAVSSYEKDGTMVTLPIRGGNRTSTTYPVGDATIFGAGYGARNGFEIEALSSNTCLDEECNNVVFVDQYVVGTQVVFFAAGPGKKLTQDEWVAAVEAAYTEANVPTGNRFAVPMTKSCFEVCIDEETWCEFGDPSCSESPYQEPDGSLTSGGIAVITILSALFAAFVVGSIIWIIMKKREARYKTLFAKRIAQTIDVKKSMKSLSPKVLQDEFNRIDEKKNGQITKDELWSFINSGNDSDEITQRDFNAMWAALDTTGTGTVDFLEFCAFFTQCHDEYDNARKNMSNRASVRQSLATSMSAKYEEVSKAQELASGSQAIEPVPEQEQQVEET